MFKIPHQVCDILARLKPPATLLIIDDYRVVLGMFDSKIWVWLQGE